MEKSKVKTDTTLYSGYVKAFGTYNRYRRTLKRIHKETTTFLETSLTTNEANYPRCSLNLKDHAMLQDESDLINHTISNPLTIIILGQSYQVKCELVNKIFGQPIIPYDTTWIKSGHTVVFKYGSKPHMTVSLPNSFVLVESDIKDNDETNNPDLKWKEEFKLLEKDIKNVQNAITEIVVHHSILKGSKIILSGEMETKFDTAALTFEGSMPIFLFALYNHNLSSADHRILDTLKQNYFDSPIMFIHMPVIRFPGNDYQFDNCECNYGYENCPKGVPSKQYIGMQINDEKIKNETEIYNERGTNENVTSFNKEFVSESKSDMCNNRILDNLTMHKEISKENLHNLNSVPVTKKAGACDIHNNVKCNCLQLFIQSLNLNFECSCKSGNEKCESKHMPHAGFNNKGHTTGTYYSGIKHYISCNITEFCDDRLNEYPLKCIYLSANDTKFYSRLLSFVRNVAKYYLIRSAKILHNLHTKLLQNAISFAFQITRDLSITPKRIEYIRHKETLLFKKLNEIISRSQQDIQDLIESSKCELHENILHLAELYPVNESNSHSKVKVARLEIQNLVLQHIKLNTADKLNKSFKIFHESFVGTLLRCLQCLETLPNDPDIVIADDCASRYLKKILNTAYTIEVNIQTSLSIISSILTKLTQIFKDFSWKEPQVIDEEWKRNVAEGILSNLSSKRLTQSICSQFKSSIKNSHYSFLTALRHLELIHKCRMGDMKDSRYNVARVVSPALARMALESTSLIDVIVYGMPKIGREIGRGMYGVVYSCERWRNSNACAVKSVAPPDEKHFNDLSLEFYYTINLPEHPRIVQIRGSVIDEAYNGGVGPPAVLLVMDRLQRDLYSAIKIGMTQCERMQVAVDVVEGIRFLHSQGLIHRDIKLKNILLDHKGRAKITDLGFCKPDAMISGSIVGTPIHMPPELFTGHYTFSVDIYAFGILMWYLMANTTKLPKNFESCTTKDHLWTSVRKGVRPEKLSVFNAEVWELMTSCWSGDPLRRPLLGNIHTQLKAMHVRCMQFSPVKLLNSA